MGEWKRIFNWKMLLVITFAMILNIGLFLYGQMSGRNFSDTIFANQEYQRLIERYEGMSTSDAYERIIKENSAISKYVNSLKPASDTQTSLKNVIQNKNQSKDENNDQSNTENKTESKSVSPNIDERCQEMVTYFQSLSESEQTQMQLDYKALIAKIKYIKQYPDSIKQIIGNAATMKKFSIFSKPGSFSYSNIIKTGKDFERVQDVTLQLGNDKATDAFVHYYYLYYIAFALMIVIIYGLFSERENGMWSIIHCAAGGRTKLALKRLFLLMTSSFIITGILYGSTLLVSFLLYGGWGDLTAPVQTVSDFDKFTYTFSKLHYIVNNFVLSGLAIFVVSIVLWMLFVLFRNRNHTLIFTGAFIGIEILLFNKIQVQSVYNALRYVNIINLFRINETYSTYNNWGFGTHVFEVLKITLIVLAVLLTISAFVAVIKFTRMKPETKLTLITKIFAAIHKSYQKIFTYFPITTKELHKLVITGRGLWVVAAVVIIAIYFSGAGIMNFTDGQMEKDKMYLEHGGKDYSYITNYVDEQNQIYNEAKQKLDEAAVKYQSGEIDMKTYIQAANNFQYNTESVRAIKEYVQKIEYLQNIKQEHGIDGYMISDRGYEEIFGQYSRQREFIIILTLVTGIMLIISESISLEYRTGMENIIRSCEKGRIWIFRRKTAACILFTIGLFMVVYGIDFWNLKHFYGMPYLQAPIMSLTFMKGCAFKVSILQWMLILLGARLLICLVTMAIAIIISKMIGKNGNRALMPLVLAGIIGVIAFLHGMGGII